MTEDLVALALEDPARAEPLARGVLDAGTDPAELSAAHQALGIVLRDKGQPLLALPDLRAAVTWANRSGDAERVSDVRATYGLTLVVAGRPRSGLRQLDLAVAAAGPRSGLTLMRRAVALGLLGRDEDGHRDMLTALDGFRAADDRFWEAQTLHNLGYMELSLGQVDEAEDHTTQAMVLLERSGRHLEALWSEQNLGEIAFARGDLPRALAVFDRVAQEYDALGHSRPHLATARCQAYLAAGLAVEAARVADKELTAADLLPIDRAGLELLGATARLDASDADGALELGVVARDRFRRQGVTSSENRARLVVLRARRQLGTGRRWAAEAAAVANALDAAGADEAPVALIVAARSGAPEARGALLDRAARYRTRRTDLVRASGWLARGLEREGSGDRGGVLRACGRGLDALDDHRRILGSTELRALATLHGRELAALALRHAADEPRTLLRWSERFRSTSLAQPPVTPGEQPVLESLAALRDNGRRLAQARADGEPTDELERERARLERAVRAEHHQVASDADAAVRLDVDHLVGVVGPGCLVELVDVDGVLHVLVVHEGRVRRQVAGTTAEALELTDSAGFVLRRAARGRPFVPGDLGERLQAALLGPAAALLPDGPVVVVPTARLHGVPWALLPALAGRAFGVVPSAAQWLRARSMPVPADPRVVLLAGPGLGTGGAEVPVLARRRADAVLLDGDGATVEAAMRALDGAGVAHVAAHGRFRADSPLFSALELADGPLTVHDLERLKVAPHRMVLSACDSGVLAPVGADELLGLASALFALGTAGLVCSVAEVNDEATAALMVDLHDHLDRGLDPAAALLAVRQAAPGDPTAAAFVALGV